MDLVVQEKKGVNIPMIIAMKYEWSTFYTPAVVRELVFWGKFHSNQNYSGQIGFEESEKIASKLEKYFQQKIVDW